jgi:hypothetical protein
MTALFLDCMREFVRQEFLPRRGLGREFPFGKADVLPSGEGEGGNLPCRGGGLIAVMHPHGGKVGAEARLEIRAQVSRQRLACATGKRRRS